MLDLGTRAEVDEETGDTIPDTEVPAPAVHAARRGRRQPAADVLDRRRRARVADAPYRFVVPGVDGAEVEVACREPMSAGARRHVGRLARADRRRAGGRRRSPAAPTTPRRTPGSRPARTPRRSRTCSGRCSPSPASSASSSPPPSAGPSTATATAASRSPSRPTASPALEIGLTILPAVILIGVAIPTVGTLLALAKTDDTECYVNVTGQQWWWEVDYPHAGRAAAASRRRSSRAARWSSRPTPTCSCAAPAATSSTAGGSRGSTASATWSRAGSTRVRLQADEPGIYAGQCTEFCGLSHANMRMEVVALDPADFETWKANQLDAVHGARGGHAGRHGRADVHRPVLALPPGRRPARRRRQPGDRHSPSCTCGPRRRPT